VFALVRRPRLPRFPRLIHAVFPAAPVGINSVADSLSNSNGTPADFIESPVKSETILDHPTSVRHAGAVGERPTTRLVADRHLDAALLGYDQMSRVFVVGHVVVP